MEKTAPNTNRVFEPRLPKKRMSKRKKTVLISLLAALLLAALVVGLCLLFAPPPPVISYHGIRMDAEMYAFWFSVIKNELMRPSAYNIPSTKATPAFWASACLREDANGRTWGEYMRDAINEAISLKLIAAVMYDELGLTMADGQRERVRSYYDDLLAYAAEGDKATMSRLLETYKTSKGALERCAVLDMKAELLYYQLGLNKGAGMGTTEEGLYLKTSELTSYYLAHYSRVKIVYINDASGDATNAADKAALDAHWQNNTMTEALFDEFVARSDEGLHGEGAYPSGIYVNGQQDLTENGFLEAAVADEVYTAAPGNFLKIKTDAGWRYIYGYALDGSAFLRPESEIFFADFFMDAAALAITNRAKAELDKIEIHDEQALSAITAEAIPHNVHFKPCTMGN